jgi:hypothetical protein
MIQLIKDAVRLSVYHIARETVSHIEQQMKKEDKGEQDIKRKMLVVGTVHALLGIIYND